LGFGLRARVVGGAGLHGVSGVAVGVSAGLLLLGSVVCLS